MARSSLTGRSGQYSDPETGLIYLRARYYDPATGQFLSRDPAVALTQSAYGYVQGNPLNGTDPSGLWDYYKHYDLGASVMSPEDMMSLVAANFGGLFPVSGHKATLYEGETMNLHWGPIPGHVRVANMTATGWTFDTQFLHADFPGFISFNFQQTSDCHLHLDIHANVQGLGWLAQTNINPLGNYLYMRKVKQLWGSFAGNLRKEVQAANQYDAING